MRILIIGGGRFLGRAFAEEAITAGHDVTVFNRGQSSTDPPGARVIHGDRENPADLEHVARAAPASPPTSTATTSPAQPTHATPRSPATNTATASSARPTRATSGSPSASTAPTSSAWPAHSAPGWDVVIDTCGYAPAVVSQSARILADRAAAYLFISSVNAYERWPAEPVTAASPKFACDPEASEGEYGPLKAGCERVVEQYFPGRTITLDAGLILGPHENRGRLTWWLSRIARGAGPVLAPAEPKRPIAPIDARDLARFGLTCAANGSYGAFAVPGPGTETMQDMLEACVAATGSGAHLVWAPDAFLVEHGVEQWTGLPLWAVAEGELSAVWDIDPGPARAAGLTWRPIAETVRDTWAWLSSGEAIGGAIPDEDGRINGHGLSPDREEQLLALLR